MICPYAEHNICQIATRLANLPVELNKTACSSCLTDIVPMSVNRITAAIAARAQSKANLPVNRNLLRMATGRYDLAGYKLERYVYKWLKRLRIKISNDCGCESWVNKMNAWGITESLNHLDEITDQLYNNLQTTYLAGLTIPWLTKTIIRQRVKACLLKERL